MKHNHWAAAIALRQATEQHGIKHAISFHRSIKAAESFTNLNVRLNASKVDKVDISSYHISSKKTAGQRSQLMDDFKNDKLALMTNAKCLTEGVNVPAIDCVLFADPKQSVVDIVQAAGRALRVNEGKKFGYIMMPLIVPDDMELLEFTESTPFKQVARIVAGLSTQDERIVEELRLKSEGKKVSTGRIDIIGTVPVGFQLDISSFAASVEAKYWEKVGRANWRSFAQARLFARDLKLKTGKEWVKFSKSENMPFDIPSFPSRVYANEWKSMGDFLGTGRVADQLKVYRSFTNARSFVRELNLKSRNEWASYCRSGKKPIDIPNHPNQTYQFSGWISMGDWLGTGIVAPRLRRYRSFKKAKKYAQNLGLKNRKEWENFTNSPQFPIDIPKAPQNTYKNHGWISMGDWLGNGNVATYLREYLNFDDAKKFVISLNLKNGDEWRRFCKSTKKPPNIPSKPSDVYRDKGWKSMGDWLGTGKISNSLKEYLPFKEAKKFVLALGLKNQQEWRRYVKSGKLPENIPANPNIVYEKRGWVNLGDWLGTGTIASNNLFFRDYNSAKRYVNSLNLKSQSEWKSFCKSSNKPKDIPANPYQTYDGKGWVSFGEWLGNNIKAPRDRTYLPFDEAKKIIKKMNFQNVEMYRLYCKSEKKREDIPAAADRVYKNKGWISWKDFLGKE